MSGWNSPTPYVLLIAGFSLFLLGVVATYTGKASSRYKWVYRAEDPSGFWWLVAMYYLGGVVFVVIFLCTVT